MIYPSMDRCWGRTIYVLANFSILYLFQIGYDVPTPLYPQCAIQSGARLEARSCPNNFYRIYQTWCYENSWWALRVMMSYVIHKKLFGTVAAYISVVKDHKGRPSWSIRHIFKPTVEEATNASGKYRWLSVPQTLISTGLINLNIGSASFGSTPYR